MAIDLVTGIREPAASTFPSPQLRTGSHFPDWLIEPPRRASGRWSPWSPSATSKGSLPGASTTWFRSTGRGDFKVPGLRPGRVSRRGCGGVWQPAPSTLVPAPTSGVDALTSKVREGGSIVTEPWVIATGLTTDTEILGLDLITTEDGLIVEELNRDFVLGWCTQNSDCVFVKATTRSQGMDPGSVSALPSSQGEQLTVYSGPLAGQIVKSTFLTSVKMTHYHRGLRQLD